MDERMSFGIWGQRGHQNSLEVMPIFLVLVLLGGLEHPLLSAAFGVLYALGRYFYFKGYATGDPNNRLKLGYSSLYSSYFLLKNP